MFNHLRLARQRDANARQSQPASPSPSVLLSEEAILDIEATLSQLIMISEALDRRIGNNRWPFSAPFNLM